MDEVSKEVVKQMVLEVYKDLLRPAVQPSGIILSLLPRTIRILFSNPEKWAIKHEKSFLKWQEELDEKVKTIPEGKLREPKSNIVIPAIQQLSYCDSDTLRDLYTNLLVSSMNIDTKWMTHPAFSDIIKQLTPDEAKILKELQPNIKISYPLIDVVNKNNDGGFLILISNFTNIQLSSQPNKTEILDKIEIKDNICSYVENLERLKLVEIRDSHIGMDRYRSLKENDTLNSMIKENVDKNMENIDYIYKVFTLTNFGVNFINICCATKPKR